MADIDDAIRDVTGMFDFSYLTGYRDALNHAAEQIKALNMRATTSGWLSVNDVLAVLDDMKQVDDG